MWFIETRTTSPLLCLRTIGRPLGHVRAWFNATCQQNKVHWRWRCAALNTTHRCWCRVLVDGQDVWQICKAVVSLLSVRVAQTTGCSYPKLSRICSNRRAPVRYNVKFKLALSLSYVPLIGSLWAEGGPLMSGFRRRLGSWCLRRQ